MFGNTKFKDIKMEQKTDKLSVMIGMHIRTLIDNSDKNISFYAKIIDAKVNKAEYKYFLQVGREEYDKMLNIFKEIFEEMKKEVGKGYLINQAYLISSLYSFNKKDFKIYSGLSDHNFNMMIEQAESQGLTREVESNKIVDMFTEKICKHLSINIEEKKPSWAK